MSVRNRQPELMDNPELDDAAHRQARGGLGRINRLSYVDAAIWKVIRPLEAMSTANRPLTILDIASGGGDLAIRLARLAQRDLNFLKVELLLRMKAAASQLVLVDDLRRMKLGYWLAWIGCRLLGRCYVVYVDGPLSVQEAISTEEARSISGRAGLINTRVRHHWPQRFLLTWSPDNERNAFAV